MSRRADDRFEGPRRARWLALGLLCALLGTLPATAMDSAGAQRPGRVAPTRAERRELDRGEAQLRQAIQALPSAPELELLRDPARLVLRVPARLLFDAESTIPRADAAARTLLLVARQLLRRRPGLDGRVEVYTDGIGGLEANLRIAQQRADALCTWLSEEGVPAARLRASARGASAPLGDDHEPEGRMRNRRVELVFEPAPPA